MANKEYLELAKRMSEPLSIYGINAYDLDTKTLNNCDRLLKGIAIITEKRNEHFEALKRFTYTFENIADACGMNRRTLSENETYSKIIANFYEGYDTRTNEEIRDLRIRLDKYRKNEEDQEKKLRATALIQEQLALAKAENERYKREKKEAEVERDKEREEKIQAQKRLLELEEVIRRLRSSGSS